jgi:hypothetical protein
VNRRKRVEFTTQSKHTSQYSNIGHENNLSNVDRTGLWNFAEDSLSVWGASACIRVVLWLFCDGERSWWKIFERCVPTSLFILYTSPYKVTQLSSVRRPFICIGGSSSTVCALYVVKSLNSFSLFMQTDSPNLVKTEYVTGVWEALRVEKVNYLYSSSYTWYYYFLFGATAPSGPGPPHSRGF